MLKNNYKKIVFLLEIIILLMLIGPVVLASRYSVLVADDYSHGVTIGAFHVDFFSYLLASVKFAYTRYMTWHGAYSSMFVQALFSPINNFGLVQLHIFMLVNAVLLFASFGVCVLYMIRKYELPMHVKLAIMICVVYPICTYQTYEEVFFWYSGATSYSIPLSFLFIGVAYMLKHKTDMTKPRMGIMFLVGVMVSGGSLSVAGLGCYIILLICIYRIMTESDTKIKRQSIYVLICWIALAIVNVLGPGNYVRHGQIDQTGLHPGDAIANSLEMTISRFRFFFGTTNFIFILICMFIIGFLSIRLAEKQKKANVIVAIFGLGLPIVTSFPIALGYSRVALPNRCVFIIDMALIIALLYFSFSVGMCLQSVFDVKEKKIVIFVSVMIAINAFFYNLNSFEPVNIQIRKQLLDNTYYNYYNSCLSLYNQIELCVDGSDFGILETEFPQKIDYFYCFYLTNNPNWWVNKAVANYYNLNNVYIYSE